MAEQRFTLARVTHAIIDTDLDDRLAVWSAPHVARLADKAKESAAAAAPGVKVWQTAFDALVRPWHVSAHGQSTPANLRYALDHSPRQGHQYPPPKHPRWGERYSHETEYLREPRDPTAYYLQVQACRCFQETNNRLGESFNRTEVVVSGSHARCEVYTRYPRAAESNFGTADDTPARFMEIGARLAALATH